jgi:hypothetical protein
MACAVALVVAPAAMAQDMTAGMVTDPPAPVADGVATFTATYQNLGPGNADNVNYDVLVPILQQTWPPEGDGFNAMLESTVGTDTNGNEVFWGFDTDSMCNYYLLELQIPNDTGDQPMQPNPFPAGTSGSFSFGLPVIPMEGVASGRVIITEPESLQNSYGVNSAQWTTYSWLTMYAGLYNLVSTGALCDEGGEGCVDTTACIGDRLWETEPFEAALELGQGNDGDPLLGCGTELTGFTAGNIAVVRRGTCNFTVKMENAQNAGAVGMIMVNDGRCSDIPDSDPDECVITMGGDAGTGFIVDLPAVLMGRRQGEEIIAALQGSETVRAQMGAIPGDRVDIYSWVFSDTDPDLTNDYLVTRVPLGEMGPTSFLSFIPAAAYAAGAQGAFFQTDLDINNKGAEEATVTLLWLPRGADNSAPTASDPIVLAAGQSVQYENVLNAVFGAEPDVAGALAMVADSADVIAMSRTYNVPGAKIAGTFGQGLPGIPSDQLIGSGETRRIIFMSENDDIRANVGCVNGLNTPLRINIDMHDATGAMLETRTMDLAPWSNNQINRIFRTYAPVNGYVDVSTPTEDAAFYCYGSVLDNLTSDPTTVLPQVPSDDFTFIPAAALAAGAQGAFFQTDVDLNNAGTTAATYQFAWLPRGEDNSTLTLSDPFTLEAGASVRYENVLNAVFGAEPDAVGALAVSADTPDLLAMSRTYNIPGAKIAGTFGQELPGIPADMMIATGEKKRIIFMNENDDVRANVGCQNGVDAAVRVNIELFSPDGTSLETKFMDLQPWSNNQINRVFRNYAPVNGYVDIWTTTPDATIYCYGSVLDNLTSDPTTVLPQ